jgi:hypothetical protein
VYRGIGGVPFIANVAAKLEWPAESVVSGRKNGTWGILAVLST